MPAYTVTKPAYQIHRTDGSLDTIPAETITFTTGAAVLRWAIDAGVFRHVSGNRPPKRFDDVYLTSRYGWSLDPFTRWRFSDEAKAAAVRAQARYTEIVRYLSEVEPEWRPDVEATGNAEGIVNYADNSTEIHEINKYGKRRRRMTVAPHGDACF
jgi:hypothetical protein